MPPKSIDIPSESSTMTPTKNGSGPDKRGIRFNPHVQVQGDPGKWDLAEDMSKLKLGGKPATEHARAGSQSDSSADSAPVATPLPKDVDGPAAPGVSLHKAHPSQHRPTALPQGYPYRGPNAPVTLGHPEEILQVDYNLQPRHYLPSSIASSPSSANHSPNQTRGPNAANMLPNGATPFIPTAVSPGLIGNPAFYGQPGLYNPPPGPSGGDPVPAANEVAAMIITNAIQQAAAITGQAGGQLNPAALAAAYSNPQFMANLYTPNMYQPSPPAGNPYYPSRPDPAMAAVAAAMANMPQATFQAALQQAGYGLNNPAPSNQAPSSNSTVGGPSPNNRKLGLYKSELCRSWSETGSCRYGLKCQFAHGEDELRRVARHPKYKTEICRTFWVSGSCPYGKRCCFIHTELPANGAAPPTSKEGEAAAAPETRARSQSTNSDPDQQTSMLARLRRNENATPASGASTPPTATTPASITYGRPSPAALRVDTSSLDSATVPKESYPYTSGAVPPPGLPAVRKDHVNGRRSPAPVTAGPDFGRHTAAARLEVVGSANAQHSRTGGHLRSLSQTFPSSEQNGGGISPTISTSHLRSDSWSATSALAAPSSAIDPPARYNKW